MTMSGTSEKAGGVLDRATFRKMWAEVAEENTKNFANIGEGPTFDNYMRKGREIELKAFGPEPVAPEMPAPVDRRTLKYPAQAAKAEAQYAKAMAEYEAATKAVVPDRILNLTEEWQLRRGVDDSIIWKGADAERIRQNDLLRDVRSKMRDHMEGTLEQHGALDAWKIASKDYQGSQILKDIADYNVNREMRVNSWSLRGSIMTGAGASAGGAIAGLPGAIIGGAVGKIATAAMIKHGSGLAVHGLDTAIEAAEILERGFNSTGEKLDKIPAFMSGLTSAEAAAARKETLPSRAVMELWGFDKQDKDSTPEAYSKFADHIVRAIANPQKIAENLSKQAAALAPGNAKVQQAYVERGMGVLTYMAGQIQPSSQPGGGLFGSKKKLHPSDAKISSLMAQAEIAALGPFALLTHIERGTLTDAHVKASMGMFPSTTREMVGRMGLWGTQNPDLELPPRARAQLGKLMGVTFDKSYGNIAGYQATFIPPQEKQGKAPRVSASKLPGMQTDTGRISDR
jgi:hypothetical protein